VHARFDEPRQLPGFDVALAEALAGADVAFVEYPFWMPYVAPVARRSGIPVVLSLYDIHSAAHADVPMAAARIATREQDAIRLADAVFCTSREDQAYLRTLGIHADVTINPIDVEACRPADEASVRAFRARYGLGSNPLCAFIGSRIVPNVEAVAALERLAPELPMCTFVVAGRCAPKGRRGNVVRLGWLDASELEALYAAAAAIVMPLSSGTGTSLKFVEALAYGKAIVATTVAARGYEAVSGVHAHLVPDLRGVASGVRRIMEDHAYRGSLEGGARSLATRYDFRTVFEPYGAWLRRGRTHLAAGGT
jgi:glycosyltransferase involved in cell wall biosynthesis